MLDMTYIVQTTTQLKLQQQQQQQLSSNFAWGNVRGSLFFLFESIRQKLLRTFAADFLEAVKNVFVASAKREGAPSSCSSSSNNPSPAWGTASATAPATTPSSACNLNCRLISQAARSVFNNRT